MTDPNPTIVLIVGVGDGLSDSLARLFGSRGYGVELASRRPERLTALAGETGARPHRCDATDPHCSDLSFPGRAAPRHWGWEMEIRPWVETSERDRGGHIGNSRSADRRPPSRR